MALLSNLKQRLKFWWSPRWEQNYSYVVEGHPGTFRITQGKYTGKQFLLDDIMIDDVDDETGDGIVSFAPKFLNGPVPKEIVCAIFQDLLARAIERSKELHEEVLNDDTEDSRANYTEEPVDERRIRETSVAAPEGRVLSGTSRESPVSNDQGLPPKV